MTINHEIRGKIVNEYSNGKKINEIVKEFGISKQSIFNILKEREIKESSDLKIMKKSEEGDKGITSESLNKKLKGNENMAKQIKFLDEEKKPLENQVISLKEENKKLSSIIDDLTLKNTQLVEEKNALYSLSKKEERRVSELETHSEIEISIIVGLLFLVFFIFIFNI